MFADASAFPPLTYLLLWTSPFIGILTLPILYVRHREGQGRTFNVGSMIMMTMAGFVLMAFTLGFTAKGYDALQGTPVGDWLKPRIGMFIPKMAPQYSRAPTPGQ